MFDLEEYTVTVARYASNISLNFTPLECEKIFGTSIVVDIFRKYTLSYIKMLYEKHINVIQK